MVGWPVCVSVCFGPWAPFAVVFGKAMIRRSGWGICISSALMLAPLVIHWPTDPIPFDQVS